MTDRKARQLSCSEFAATSGLHEPGGLATLWSVFAATGLCVSVGFANLGFDFDQAGNLIAAAACATILFPIAPFGVKAAHSVNATAPNLVVAARPIATSAIVLYNDQTG